MSRSIKIFGVVLLAIWVLMLAIVIWKYIPNIQAGIMADLPVLKFIALSGLGLLVLWGICLWIVWADRRKYKVVLIDRHKLIYHIVDLNDSRLVKSVYIDKQSIQKWVIRKSSEGYVGNWEDTWNKTLGDTSLAIVFVFDCLDTTHLHRYTDNFKRHVLDKLETHRKNAVSAA